MMLRRLMGTALFALFAVVLSACASTASTGGADPGAAPAGDGSVQIVVQNNVINAEEAAILVEGGIQRSLGSVPANQTRTFTVDLEPRQYELVARGLTGTNTISFQLYANTARVTWNMEADRVDQTSR